MTNQDRQLKLAAKKTTLRKQWATINGMIILKQNRKLYSFN